MTGINSGSLIDARNSVDFLPIMLIFLGIAVLVAIVFFISQAIKHHRESPEYLRKQKERPIKYNDIISVAKICSFTHNETNLMWQICESKQQKNALLLEKKQEEFEYLLKNEYYELKDNGAEDEISVLFSMRKKILTSFIPHIIIKHSKAIDSGITFVYTAAKGIHYNLEYKEKTEDGLYLEIPTSLANGDEKPEAMRKIDLNFISKDGTAYKINTRVIRYQKNKFGEDFMVCAHSDNIMLLAKRTSDRVYMDSKVQFAAVKTETTGSGRKQKTIYTPLENRYDGKLIDISAGGCRIVSKLPIKSKQKIYIEGMFNNMEIDHAIGTITRTTKRKDGLIVLHIKFVEITQAVVNKILAMACHYN